MADVTVHSIVDATPAQVWASWDDFGAISVFNPNLKSSQLLPGSEKTGIGATRQCDLADGKNHIRERIVEYVPEQKMVIDIYEGTMPLKSAVATIQLSNAGSGRTRVSFTMRFEPKFGLLGKMMVPMMKKQFSKMLQALVDTNARFVESNSVVKAA